MNSCFNCLDFGNPRCILHKDCEKWRPDYLTLEAENAELKRRGLELMDELIVHKRALGLSVKHNLKDIIKFLALAQKEIEEDLNEGDFEDEKKL